MSVIARNSGSDGDKTEEVISLELEDSSESSDDESDAEMEALAKLSCEKALNLPKLSPTLDVSDSDLDSESDDNDEDVAIKTLNACAVINDDSDSQKEIPSALKHDKGLLEISSDSDDEQQDMSTGFVIDRTSNLVTANKDPEQDQQAGESASSKKKRRRRKKKKDKEINKEAVDPMALSSSLQVGFDTSDIYVNIHAEKQPKKPKEVSSIVSGSSEIEQFMKKSVISSDFEKQHTILPYQESVNQIKKQRRKEREQTKGRGWHDMKAKEMTESDKNDLTLLQMRRVLDPKRFYKANDLKALPKFYQMGKVVDSPLDFYSNRIPKKERKQTLVDELLADAEFRKFNKRKYTEIVESKAQGRGAYKHMKRLKKRKR